MPESVALHLVDVRELNAPEGSAAIHWRLLTSHAVNDLGVARKIVDFYRKRWNIEDYFKTLKSAGFQLEGADIATPLVMLKFTAMCAIAAVTVTQLLRARDNLTGQSLAATFDLDDQPVLSAICKDYEGTNPTKRQANPQPPDTLAFATWVIARLDGWTGYCAKPGAQTLNRGLQRYYAIKYGSQIAREIV